MTPEKVIELAKQAGAARFYPERQTTTTDSYLVGQEFLQRFAELVLKEAECGSGAGCLYKEARIEALEEQLCLVRNEVEGYYADLLFHVEDAMRNEPQPYEVEKAVERIRSPKSCP